MFEVGQKIVYSTHGICEITEKKIMEVGKEKKEYYVLAPVFDVKSIFYVPVDNAKTLNTMRKLLTQDEIDDIITSVSANKTEWIVNDIERKEFCLSAISSGNRCDLMRVIGMLYMRQKDLKSQKKHIHISDERYLKTAEKMLHEEFSYVLNIPAEKVPDYIKNKIENN